jgi:hypothetical protein
MPYFDDWLFDKLPIYYHLNDSYKDANDKGLLKRYLENIGEDLDNNILPLIDNLLDVIDPTTQASTNYKFINHLAYTVGSPPDIFLGDPAQAAKYAKLVNHIVSIYKIKGTKKSFVSFFALLGYTVSIIEWPLEKPTLYDNESQMDTLLQMDKGCQDCSEFSILNQAVLLSSFCGDTGNPVLDPSLFQLIVDMAAFLQPINTKLRTVISGGVLCEYVDYCYDGTIVIKRNEYARMDTAVEMDGTDEYDMVTVLSTTTINDDCI